MVWGGGGGVTGKYCFFSRDTKLRNKLYTKKIQSHLVEKLKFVNFFI